MAAKSPVRPKFSNISTVTLLVGKHETAFHVHEDLLCKASPVFDRAFHSEFKEASEKRMVLPEDDAEIFEYFVDCLYSRTFNREIFGLELWDGENGHIMRSAHLFVLADKYDVETLKIDVCKDIFNFASTCTKNDRLIPPAQVVVRYIWANTCRKSLLRLVVADWFAWSNKYTWQGEGNSTDWLYDIPEFGVDLALALDLPASKTEMAYLFNGDESAYIEKVREQGQST